MFQEIEVGKVYTGKVVSITQFGAFMEVLTGKGGFVHVSNQAEGRTEKVEAIVKNGRVNMSGRAWLPDQAAAEAQKQQPLIGANDL